MAGTIIFCLINSICMIVFISIGIYAWRKPTPMWFWAGSEDDVEKEVFTDIKAYNQRNAIMWITYGVSFLIPFLLKPILNKGTFMIVYLCIVIGGMVLMALYYTYIHKKYTRNKAD